MAGVTRWAVLLAAASLCACSRPPNPVVAHDPIPQPPPGYAVRCSSTPFILNGYITHCTPGLKPVEEGVILLGASTGGCSAIATVLSSLPPDSPPVICVQHLPAGFSAPFAERLNNACKLHVAEARPGDVLDRKSVV